MSVPFVVGYDATADNIDTMPASGEHAGYTTGGAGIEWTTADWAKYPDALRICQDAGATDDTADYLDMESGAATPADCPGWAKRAKASYAAATRPGQRHPSIYMSASNVTLVVNALKGGGVTSGVGLIVANWDLTEAEAIADVDAASGPFPINGLQIEDAGDFDINVFSKVWVDAVSTKVVSVKRYVADGKTSLVDAAHALKTTVEHVAQESATHMSNANLRALIEYLGGGNWGLLDHSGAHELMPKGLVYWA